MTLALPVLAVLLATPGTAGGADDLVISIAGYELAANGAEKPAGVSRKALGLRIGEPKVAVFSMWGCGYFGVTVPPHSFEENATTGWRVEVTPLKVVNHAATFRLRWVRALDKSGALEPASEDVEVTLKAGESRPLDTVPVAREGAKTFDAKPCTTKAVSLRVSVDFPDFDRRLIGAELWLVERTPDGKERSQSQILRGVPNRAIPFYFDTATDGTKRLDIFGKLLAEPVQGGVDVNLEAIRGVPNRDQEDGYQSALWFRSTVHMNPGEIVEVVLPPPDDKNMALADRKFSIRIRSKQIR